MGLLFESKAAMEPDYMRKKKQAEKAVGRSLSKEEFESEFLGNGGGRKNE